MLTKVFFVAAALATLSPFGLTAQASSVGFTGLPKAAGAYDVAASGVNFSYNHTTGALTITTGTDGTLAGPNTLGTGDVMADAMTLLHQGAFSFTVFLNSDGTVNTGKLGSDTLSALGGSTSTNPLYTAGPLLNFGFDNVSLAPVNLLFGSAGGQFGGSGPVEVRILSVPGFSSTNFVNFGTDFTGSGFSADTFTAVPLPSAALMGITLLPALSILRKRRLAKA